MYYTLITGHGFKLAPVVGKILSELALNATPSYDLSPFKIQQSYSVRHQLIHGLYSTIFKWALQQFNKQLVKPRPLIA